jgi:hypothetical protein
MFSLTAIADLGILLREIKAAVGLKPTLFQVTEFQ